MGRGHHDMPAVSQTPENFLFASKTFLSRTLLIYSTRCSSAFLKMNVLGPTQSSWCDPKCLQKDLARKESQPAEPHPPVSTKRPLQKTSTPPETPEHCIYRTGKPSWRMNTVNMNRNPEASILGIRLIIAESNVSSNRFQVALQIKAAEVL